MDRAYRFLNRFKLINDYEGIRDKKSTANGRNQVKRNRYVSSPIQWTYAHNQHESSSTNDRTDFIEIVSEPEEMCRTQRSSMVQPNTSKAINTRPTNNNGYDTPKKPSQSCDDSNAFSIWERDTNEHTIIFHHKSDVGDKCCDNYCPRNESDTEMEINADRSFTTKISDDDNNCTPNGKQKNCCKSMSTSLELLNNSMPLSNVGGNTSSQSTALANFQKNNISQTGSHRLLDLSSDIRRYSKITNFEQQNASNLLPNYLTRSSNTNLNEPSTATSFELFNIPSTSTMYDKPFGSINLTTQNHFESQSSSSGTGTQRQHVNNFNSNNDSYNYSNVRTENTTSNNNQLDAWMDGDNQQTNAGGQSFNSTTVVTATLTGTHANGLSNDQNNLSSNYLFTQHTTPQLNTNHTTTTNTDNSHNNNLPIILNNNNDNSDTDQFGTLRTKFKKIRKFFTKN
ncbi:putative uncharacterized protein DDB_G0282133 [Contarinia nasturtii]|uniref:putative uncharacterized protein DDB_G0282133 n=1 Tax=Contarinia nasturtii TaxID=265458 RepID=UPI0012D4B1D6|nr:putative uncharacterized protein DDB_G0282133 [Contarinia nasturtii]